jgi:hypothetical protein
MKTIVKIALSAFLLRALVTMAPAEDTCLTFVSVDMSYAPTGWAVSVGGPCVTDNGIPNVWSGLCISSPGTNCDQARINGTFYVNAFNWNNTSTNDVRVGVVRIGCINGKYSRADIIVPGGSPGGIFWFTTGCSLGPDGDCGVAVCKLCADPGRAPPQD